MEKFIVSHSGPLKGTVKISGSKNAALPILAASLLTQEQCVMKSIPALRDIYNMLGILKDLGAEVDFNKQDEVVTICSANIIKTEGTYELAGKMRASFLIMGPLLARFGRAKIPLPGGCPIGQRPVDLHLKGFAAMGAKINQEHGFVEVTAEKLTGAKIYLDFPSVGATENIMMAAALAQGTTIIENAAAEPEISDLANFLNAMGAKVACAGTDTVRIEGVGSLKGVTHRVIPDRIEAGTFMVASAITKGDILLENVIYDHLKPIVAKLEEIHVKSEQKKDGLRVYYNGQPEACFLKTMPFPGFPTDMQAPFMSLLSVAHGTSMITETIFENRFMHAGELKRMGANIKIESRSAVIEGVDHLTAAKVKATDLRAGAALILAALTAKGDTEISDIYHIERGYDRIEEKLKRLGANIIKKDIL